jgi:hypothetical protein
MRNVVTLDQMKAFVALGENPEPAATKPSRRTGTSRFLMDDYLRDRGKVVRQVEPTTGGTKYVLDCPFDAEHRGKDAAVFLYDNGGMHFKCFHSSCSSYRWKDFCQQVGNPDPHHWNPPLQTSNGNTDHAGGFDAEPPGGTAERISNIRIFKLGELVKEFPTMRQPLIDGLLRFGEIMNVIASPKVGKSWMSYGLAVAIATGTEWLGFQTTQGRVLLVDYELHHETLANRIRAVAEKTGLPKDQLYEMIDVVPLRGQCVDIHELQLLLDRVEHGQYAAIVIDALYKALPDGVSENDNAAMARVFAKLDRYTKSTGAAIVPIHHASKGSQAEKAVTDVGAGAGSQARAADTHLVIREHEEESVFILDAVVRSFPPVDSMAIRFEYPVWHTVAGVDTGKLKGRHKSKDEKFDDDDRRKQRELLAIFVNNDTTKDSPLSVNGVRQFTRIGADRAMRLLNGLVTDGKLDRGQVEIAGNTTTGYWLVDLDDN